MRKLMVWLILFFLVWASPPQLFAESKPPLPLIDLEVIIAGLAHTESLLKSGRGKLKFYMASYFNQSRSDKEITVKQVEKGRSRPFSSVEELEFAFSKTYSYFNNDGSKFIADGNIQLVISPQGSISMYFRVAYPPEGLDPRDWGLWYRQQRLSDYLRQQKGVQLIGNEKIDGIPCYVIQTPEKSAEDPTVKFWITPENGFRLVQIHHQTQTRKNLNGKHIHLMVNSGFGSLSALLAFPLRKQKLSPSKMRWRLQILSRIPMCQSYLIFTFPRRLKFQVQSVCL